MITQVYDNEPLSFLALSAVRGVGFETLKKFACEGVSFRSLFREDAPLHISDKVRRNPSYRKIFDTLSDIRRRTRCIDEGKRIHDSLKARNISIVFQGDDEYPKQLLDLKDIPKWLFVEGSIDALHKPSITAVGSRKTSKAGEWLAKYLGYCIRELDAVTISGLAIGIDYLVHRSSLKADLPTVAVLGAGVLLDYPATSHDLRNCIVENGGTIVSEYLPNDTYSARNFVRRNRIQAALGRLAFPIEWKKRSGTMHTVKYATELDRPLVFARTPDQRTHDWIPQELRHRAMCFTLPKDHELFMDFIKSSLQADCTVMQPVLI